MADSRALSVQLHVQNCLHWLCVLKTSKKVISKFVLLLCAYLTPESIFKKIEHDIFFSHRSPLSVVWLLGSQNVVAMANWPPPWRCTRSRCDVEICRTNTHAVTTAATQQHWRSTKTGHLWKWRSFGGRAVTWRRRRISSTCRKSGIRSFTVLLAC